MKSFITLSSRRPFSTSSMSCISSFITSSRWGNRLPNPNSRMCLNAKRLCSTHNLSSVKTIPVVHQKWSSMRMIPVLHQNWSSVRMIPLPHLQNWSSLRIICLSPQFWLGLKIPWIRNPYHFSGTGTKMSVFSTELEDIFFALLTYRL